MCHIRQGLIATVFQAEQQIFLARLAEDNTVERKFSFEPFKFNTFFAVRQYGNPAFDARGSLFKNPVGNQIRLSVFALACRKRKELCPWICIFCQ